MPLCLNMFAASLMCRCTRDGNNTIMGGGEDGPMP